MEAEIINWKGKMLNGLLKNGGCNKIFDGHENKRNIL